MENNVNIARTRVRLKANTGVVTDDQENTRADEVLALFRLLVRQPPKNHDCEACPICQRYGITAI